eukprot:9485109-Ditylum_brightwellii.AAC.1
MDLKEAVTQLEYEEEQHLDNKRYFNECQQGSLAMEQGILFWFKEGRRSHIRQLQTSVVPQLLRMAVFLVYHALPMAGNSGASCTTYLLVTRYWWPALIDNMERLGPLYVVFLDMWYPGNSFTEKGCGTSTLTYLCCLTLFVEIAFARGNTLDAEALAMLAMEAFFTPFGLPKLIVVNADGKFASMFL